MINYKNYEDKIPKDVKRFFKYSQMTENESIFIDGLIREFKPKKILELGVAAGTSSLVMLNAVKNTDTKLFSIDYNEQHYENPKLKTGFVMENFPEFKKNWTLYTGATAAKFMDEIGSGIDFVLLDTMHSLPGELLDYLQILPYLAPNAIIVIHDIIHHTFPNCMFNFSNPILFSILKGKKIIPIKGDYKYGTNIAAVKLADNAIDISFDVFNCLRLPWVNKIDNDYKYIKEHLSKHYDAFLIQMFDNAYDFSQKCSFSLIQSKFFNNKLRINLYKKITRTFKYIIFKTNI